MFAKVIFDPFGFMMSWSIRVRYVTFSSSKVKHKKSRRFEVFEITSPIGKMFCRQLNHCSIYSRSVSIIKILDTRYIRTFRTSNSQLLYPLHISTLHANTIIIAQIIYASKSPPLGHDLRILNSSQFSYNNYPQLKTPFNF